MPTRLPEAVTAGQQAERPTIRPGTLRGLPSSWYLPVLDVEHIWPVPGRTQHRAAGECPCGWVHIFATKYVDRLVRGEMTRRCPVDRTRRYRLVVRTVQRRYVRRSTRRAA